MNEPEAIIKSLKELSEFCDKHPDKIVWTNTDYFSASFIREVMNDLRTRMILDDIGPVDKLAIYVLIQMGHGYF